jgi:hypothetical protein
MSGEAPKAPEITEIEQAPASRRFRKRNKAIVWGGVCWRSIGFGIVKSPVLG